MIGVTHDSAIFGVTLINVSRAYPVVRVGTFRALFILRNGGLPPEEGTPTCLPSDQIF